MYRSLWGHITAGYINQRSAYFTPWLSVIVYAFSVFPSQVTIQSEEEKKLIRKQQKEERKLLKKNPELYNEIFNQNQEELEQVQNAPLFKKAHNDASRMYPYVFDSLAAKKNSSAFVGGAKVRSVIFFFDFFTIDDEE